MKKVLLATTVLAMSATVAAAEINLTGDARMGVIRDFKGDSATKPRFDLTSRARVKFVAEKQNDSGLSFGFAFRAQDAVNASNGTAGEVFVSGEFGRVSMGDVDGAATSAVGHVDGVGLTGLGDLNENNFIGNGGFSDSNRLVNTNTNLGSITGDPSALYEFSFAGANLYASITRPNFTSNETTTGATSSVVRERRGFAYGLGANYEISGYKVVAGLELLDSKPASGTGPKLKLTQYGFGADAGYAGVTVKARFVETKSKLDGSAETSSRKVSASAGVGVYEFDVTGFVAYVEDDLAAGKNKTTSLGIGAAYDLGGGAEVKTGYVHTQKKPATGGKTTDYAMDVGVSLSF